jgi:hypothetical protein
MVAKATWLAKAPPLIGEQEQLMLSLFLIALIFGQPSKKWVSISSDDRRVTLDTTAIRKIGVGTYRMAIRWEIGLSTVVVYTDEVACEKRRMRRIRSDYGTGVELEPHPTFENIPGTLQKIYDNACVIAARKVTEKASGRGERGKPLRH